MNQQPPPPDRPDPNVESSDATPAEEPRTPLWEEPKPSAAGTPGTEPSEIGSPAGPDEPLAGAASGTDTPRSEPRTDIPRSAEPETDTPRSTEPGTDTPRSTERAAWEEPRPEHRSDAPGDRAAAYRAGEPRPRHPLEENLTRKSTWLRLVFIVVFAVAWWIAELVLTAVVVVQFLWVLFNGEPNERLRAFGQSLARYAYQLFRYMTFNSDARPFPFDLDWPSGAPDSTSD